MRQITGKPRAYFVWIKGRRITTEARIEAMDRLNALALYAYRYGLKTIDCDAVLVRKGDDERRATLEN